MTNEKRQSLHYRLDELIDARERLERRDAKPEDVEMIHLVESVVALAGDILGDSAQVDWRSCESTAEYIKLLLKTWRPAFGTDPIGMMMISCAINELSRFSFGDEPVIFRPRKRRPGEKRNNGHLVMAKLRALAWNEVFKRKGFQPNRYQGAIVAAFGASSWDAIRKWREDLRPTYDPDDVDEAVQITANRLEQLFPYPEYHHALFSDGVNYRFRRGIELLPFAAYLKRLEELPADSPMRLENWRT